jgi:metal-responsive CopG/Arc/MetJ family transcriptional regulator
MTKDRPSERLRIVPVKLPASMIEELDRIAALEMIPNRSSVLRRAFVEYLQRNPPPAQDTEKA